MTHVDPWLPRGQELPGAIRSLRMRAGGADWQIYDSDANGRILVCDHALGERWQKCGLLAGSQFAKATLGSRSLSVFHSGEDYRLSPVYDRMAPASKSDALAFAAALRNTRIVDAATPLHDAIYVEELSRLLPTYTITPPSADEMVLGAWLTGGVGVSACSRRRLDTLLSWMDRSDVDDILARAGMRDADGTGTVRTRRSDDENRSDDRGDTTTQSHSGRNSVIRPASEVRTPSAFRLPGRPSLERLFNEHVIDIVRNPDKYKAFGINFPTAIALHGPPGCGKTFAVEKLVEYLDWPIFVVDSNTIGSPYIHETSKKVAEIFDKALDAAPSAIVIDEMESYLTDRSGGGKSGLHHVEEVAEFLRRIPEANANNVLVIGMTNRIDMIDPAILRRGRFDHVIEVGMPSAQEVSAVLLNLLENMPKDQTVDASELAPKLAGRPMSDAAYVVREAGRNAARQGLPALSQECLLQALDMVPARTQEEKSRPIGFIWDE